jgi:succinate dehydrogenase (ubiquinone) flavoprotein subunit
MMRAFVRAIQHQQFGARNSFLRRQQRGLASVNTQDVKGLTVIDHHYEYALHTL